MSIRRCQECEGLGAVSTTAAPFSEDEPCAHCDGKGQVLGGKAPRAQRDHGPAMDPKLARRIRDSLGITQPKLARLLGTAPETISRYENGHWPITGATRLLYYALHLHPDLVKLLGPLVDA